MRRFDSDPRLQFLFNDSVQLLLASIADLINEASSQHAVIFHRNLRPASCQDRRRGLGSKSS